MAELLELVVRTPHEVVLQLPACGVRLPTRSGQVGLRPRQEPLLLAVEPGLMIVHGAKAECFAATAGGLLETDGKRAVLYTPFAVQGQRAEEVLDALDRALALPDSELQARRRLGDLEQHIVLEIRHRPRVPEGVEQP